MKTIRIYNIIWFTLMAIGVGLLIFKITVDSEPGAVPLILLLVGACGYFVQRRKARNTY